MTDAFPPYDNFGNAALAALEPRMRLEVERCAECVSHVRNSSPNKNRWMPHAQLIARYVKLLGALWEAQDVRTLDRMLPPSSEADVS